MVGDVEPAFDGWVASVWEVSALGRDPKAEPDDDPGLLVSSLAIGRTMIRLPAGAVEPCFAAVLLPPVSENAGPVLF